MAADPGEQGITGVKVWGDTKTIERLPDRGWLQKIVVANVENSYARRVMAQALGSSSEHEVGCDLMFVPGGLYRGKFAPMVTMFRNLLPFEPRERARFGLSFTHLRYLLLKWAQEKTFRRADGLIYLNEYCKAQIDKAVPNLAARQAIIPHGRAVIFDASPRRPRRIEDCTAAEPFRILYVSIINHYKHQGNVVRAVGMLRAAGLPIQLDLVGSAYPKALRELREVMDQVDPGGNFISYKSFVPYEQLPKVYQSADLFVFASSCETFGQILLEAMASGLPVACSNRSGLPDLLREGGVYFDPESPQEIEHQLKILINDAPLREKLAAKAYENSKVYSWEKCARETFGFLSACGRMQKRGMNE
jgi:glycosyltransferase involved in cell wall biosynthesis